MFRPAEPKSQMEGGLEWAEPPATATRGAPAANLGGPGRRQTDSGQKTPGSDFLRDLLMRVSEVLQRDKAEPSNGETSDGVSPAREAQAEEVVYLLAYHPEPVSLHGTDGTSRLPEGLLPLCRLGYREQVRPAAIDTVQKLYQSGVDLKIFSPEAPEQIMTILDQTGLDGNGGEPRRVIAGPELVTLEREQLAQAAAENTIFGQVTPEQAGQVVHALREQGQVVAVVGDGVNDLPAMRQAHLSITRQSSSPAALSIADIVLLERSPQALSMVLEKGQRIANGLLDILKLYLVQISYLALLILVLWGAGLGFPYLSKQGSSISMVSVIFPSVGLSLWAPSGVLPRTQLGRLLARFVVPAAITITAAAVVVYGIFLDNTGDVSYAQLATTYTLVISDLVLVILLRPPIRHRAGDDERSGDWRPTMLVLVLLALVFMIAPIPLADALFGLRPLHQPSDYAVVGFAVLAWASAAVIIWRFLPWAPA